MAKNIKVIGRIIKCTGKEFSSGQMGESTKVTMLTIKSMVLVEFAGQMGENTKENGKMALNMVRENTKEKTGFGKKDVGNLGRG